MKPERDWLLAVLVAEPDITLAALSARLLAERGVRADTSMLSRFLSGEGISFYDSRRIAERLQTVFGADQGHREPPFRESALFALKFDMRGRMVEDSFVLSSEAWVIGRVLAGRDWTWGLDEAQQAIREHIKSLLHRPVSGDDLQRLTRWLLEEIGVADFFATADNPRFRFRSRPDRVEQEDDPLNSFLLDDLASVAGSIAGGVTSRALDQYLSRHDSGARLHVDDDGASLALIEQLMPDTYPDGCWPTERHLGLAHSQQLAVNTIMGRLAESEGLLGVNGPPGTGKTTLLRDLIAAIVTRRADMLATLPRASDAFVRNGRETGNDGGRERACFTLASSFYGFEIVGASSNNGAVENVTLELPQRDKIDESWLPEAEYFADLGELITGKPAWGLISAALGSKARRSVFVRRYFYGNTGAVKKAEAAEAPGVGTDEVPSEDAPAIDELDLEAGVETEEDVNEPVEEEDEPKGLFGWLTEKIEANEGRSPDQRKAIWRRAIAEYTAAKAAVRATAASAERIRELVRDIGLNAARMADEQDSLRTIEQELADRRQQLARLDPSQFKPIINVSDAALEHMRTGYAVDAHWLPNRQSAQTLADEATTWGRMIGPVGGKTWVGLPLAVHRRCDRPMFDLANRIAYDGAMVYGTIAPGPDKETPASLATGWIDARGASEGNWVPAEGEALRNLLAVLRADGVPYADISVVTPFKNVAQRLRAMLGGKMVHGTIHTMQGKESAVVILVLGGNTAGPGARDWAVSEPNLLNVAATRAKRRFLCDRRSWRLAAARVVL